VTAARLHGLAAAAVLQRVRWGDRAVDVPLARPVVVEPDAIVLELADGSALALATPATATQARADLRRWWARHGDRGLVAVLTPPDDAPDDALDDLIEHPPDRPGAAARVVLLGHEPLWGDAEPGVLLALEAAIVGRPAPPDDLIERLERRIERPWPPRAAPPATPRFEQIVFGLAQAHDLVHLVRGSARLRLRGGGMLTVLAGAGDPEVDDPALAAALAELLPELDLDAGDPGVLVVDGPADLADRVRAVLGARPTRAGRVHASLPTGGVSPPDPELARVVELAARLPGPVALWPCLQAGLARSRGVGIGPDAEAAGEVRAGLVGGLLEGLPDARLRWFEATSARISLADRELRVRWVGAEGAPADEAVNAWRLAAAAARWTGHTIDLLLAGGDPGTWEQARRALPAASEGHVYHLDGAGRLRARAGLAGLWLGLGRALRAAGRTAGARLSLEELRRRIDRIAARELRGAVADATFHHKLLAATPWATRGAVVAIAIGYGLQWRFDAFSSAAAVRAGALTGDTLITGEVWRWCAAAFLHAGLWHIGLNAWALWVLGRRLEGLLGPYRFTLLFLGSCLGGSALHELFAAPGDVAVGASTGILGLLGAQTALVFTRPDLTPPRIRALLWREAWINGLLILAVSLLPFVGGLAHLGGALAGFFLVATGLLTVGVRPAAPTSPRATDPAEPPLLAAAGMGAAVAAVAAVALALGIGQPWVLQTPEGRVRDVALDGGAWTIPLPGSAGAPDLRDLPSGARRVEAGDPLRDGLRITAIARPAGTGTVDFDALLALRGPADRAWELRLDGDGPTAWSSASPTPTTWWEVVAPSERLVRRSFVAIRDGVVIEIEATGTGDAAATRLSGTWARIPRGAAAHGDAWPELDPAADLAAFEALIAGDPLPPLGAVRADTAAVLAAAAALREDPDADVGLLDPDRASRVAVVLAGRGRGPLALALLDATAGAAPPALLAERRAQVFEELRRFPEALAAAGASPDPVPALYEAQLRWHAGDAKATAQARAWLDASVPWWARATGADQAMSAAWKGNRGWASLLAGDAAGCVAASKEALDDEPDLVFARYNLGLCLLYAGSPADAQAAYRRADADARRLGSPAIRRAAARDLLRAVTDEVDGAAAQYRRTFGDLAALPGYAPAGEP
jgi:membrane associated rhomboid family serine protease/tetratricopeptide (TPR) repeat protein